MLSSSKLGSASVAVLGSTPCMFFTPKEEGCAMGETSPTPDAVQIEAAFLPTQLAPACRANQVCVVDLQMYTESEAIGCYPTKELYSIEDASCGHCPRNVMVDCLICSDMSY